MPTGLSLHTESPLFAVESPAVLIVDDDELVCRSIDRVLQYHGVAVCTADSARHGFELLGDHEVHMVLSDFRIPGGEDGISFLSRVRETYPNLQRVLLTGDFLELEEIQRAINDAGVHRFLTKPWTPSTLVEAVRDCLEQWLSNVERERRMEVAQDENSRLLTDKANLQIQVARQFALVERANIAWRRTFDAIADPLTLVDAGHTLQRANLAAAREAGDDIRTLNGRRCFEALFGRADTCPVCPLVESKKRGAAAEIELADERTGRVWRITGWPTGEEGGDGVVNGLFVCHYEDITEAKALQRQVILLEKMAAIGELAGCVAHELNNPLTAILSFSQFLGRKLGDQEKLWDLAQNIEEAAQRCRAIVEGLLDFSRPSANPTEVVEINPIDLVENCITVASSYRSSKKNLRIERGLPAHLPPIKGNADELKSVFLNLINNAIQAIDGDGTVAISADLLVDERAICVRVCDTGPGIPEAIRDKIFQPFFTTKAQNKGGTGLGLAIVKRAIDAHSGRIEVSAGPRGGACFDIVIPVTPSLQES